MQRLILKVKKIFRNQKNEKAKQLLLHHNIFIQPLIINIKKTYKKQQMQKQTSFFNNTKHLFSHWLWISRYHSSINRIKTNKNETQELYPNQNTSKHSRNYTQTKTGEKKSKLHSHEGLGIPRYNQKKNSKTSVHQI